MDWSFKKGMPKRQEPSAMPPEAECARQERGDVFLINGLARCPRILFVLVVAILLAVTGCPPTTVPSPELGEPEDPFNQINTALMKDGKVVKFSAEKLSDKAISEVPFDRKKGEEPVRERRPEKVHPLLKEWVGKRPSNDVERIVVNFRDDLRIPRFPEPATDEPRDSATNKKMLARAQALIQTLKESRARTYDRLAEELSSRYKAEVVETFWLINAMAVRMPLGAVPELAEREDVMYLEPVQTRDEPPQNTNNNDDVQDGRARIVSDPYFNLGLRGGYIGLLDTGMRFTHTLFNNPSNVDFRFDCVNGGPNCNSGTGLNPNDDCWDHGTATGAIITGNARQGDAFRGVTAITLDSLKVYPSTFSSTGACTGGLNTTAAVRGFERAVEVLDRVIVAEMQGSGSYLSSIATAADNAFDAGAVVIAANGNNGPNQSTVNVPANAHKVIGVGNFDVQTGNQIAGQSRGPTSDNRFKPDIQAPTNTETASNASDTAFGVFTGTSGATPYAAGAAALLRNWLRGTSFSLDPGQVYAQLILSAQQAYPFNNTSGAGQIRLPTDGWAWWGKVRVTDGATIDIPLPINERNANTFDVALWWPEFAFQFLSFTFEWHNDIDLYLVDPNGVVRDASISIPSVFERARVSGQVVSGTWKLRIRGYKVRKPQTVYWAAHVRMR